MSQNVHFDLPRKREEKKIIQIQVIAPLRTSKTGTFYDVQVGLPVP